MSEEEAVLPDMDVDESMMELADETLGAESSPPVDSEEALTQTPEEAESDPAIDVPEDLLEEPEPPPVDPDYEALEKTVADEKIVNAMKSMRLRIKELQDGVGNAEETAALQSRVSELEGQLSGLDYQSSEEFKTKFSKPIGTLQSEIAKTAEEAGIDKASLAQIVSADRTEQIKMLRQLDNDEAALELSPMLAKLKEMGMAAQESISSAQKNYAAAAKAKTEAMTQQRETLFTEALGGLNKTHPLLRESKTKEDWLPNIRKSAEALFDPASDPKEVVRTILKGQVADHYVAMLGKQQASIKALRTEIAQLRGVRPDVDGTQPPPRNTPSNTPKEGETIDDLVAETVPGR